MIKYKNKFKVLIGVFLFLMFWSLSFYYIGLNTIYAYQIRNMPLSNNTNSIITYEDIVDSLSTNSFEVEVNNTTTAYSTIEEAWVVANNAGTATVTMLADAEISETLVVNKTANITLELKKHKLVFVGESGSVIQVEGTFMVKQGSTDGISANHKIIDPVTGQEVTVYDSLITGGKGSGDNRLGGGVFVADGGKFTLGDYVAIAGNTAGYGGGVRVNEDAIFIMNESAEIIYNKATKDGGGLCTCNAAEVTLNGGNISDNAAVAGGGIYFEGGNVDYILKGTSISNNVATTDNNVSYSGKGGGIYIDGSSVLATVGKMHIRTSVYYNTATVCGGGVYVSETGKLKVSGRVGIYENSKDKQVNNVYLEGSAKIEVSGVIDYLSIYINNTGVVIIGCTSANMGSDIPSRYFKADNESNDCVWISNEESGEVTIGHNYVNGECTICNKEENKIYWGISENGTKLTISGLASDITNVDSPEKRGEFPSSQNFEAYDATPWYNSLYDINTVEIKNGVVPKYMNFWFYNFSELVNVDFSGLDTSNVVEMKSTFANCTKLSSIDLSGFNTSQVTSMEYMFSACYTLEKLDLSTVDASNVKYMNKMLSNCTALKEVVFSENFNAVNVITMERMFNNCQALTSIDLSLVHTRDLENIEFMFSGCKVLSSVTFSSAFDTSKVKNMYCVFSNCEALTTLDLSSFNTQSVTNMSSMFNTCKSLKNIKFPVQLDASEVTTMQFIFSNCKALTTLDLSAFTTKNVTILEGMFYNCAALKEVDLSSFDAQEVTNANYMFYGCNALNKVIAPAKISTSFSTALPLTKFWNGAADVTYIDSTGAGKTFVKHAEHTGGTATCHLKATCGICGQEYGEFGDHSFALEFTVDKAATCSAKGSKSKHCSYCDAKTEITEIDMIAHSYGEWEITLASTCSATGSKKHVCTACDYEETEVIAIDENAHDWNNGIVTTEATCTTTGIKTFTCSHNSAHTKKETISATGHTVVTDGEVAPTCTEKGKTTGSHCSVCNTIIAAQSEISALGHDYGEWVIIRESTIDTFGEERRVCSHDETHFEARELPKRIAELVKPDENGSEIDEIIVTIPNGFEHNIELVVTKISQDNYAKYETIVATTNGEIELVYDVTLKSDGVTIQPDGMLTIKLRIPENLKGKNFNIFHLHDETKVDMEYTVEGDYALVTTDKLSEFIFISEKPVMGGLSSGAIAGIVIGAFIILLLSLYILCYFTLYRKDILKGKVFDSIYVPMNAIFKKKENI